MVISPVVSVGVCMSRARLTRRTQTLSLTLIFRSKFFFAYFLSNVKPERNIHIGMEFLNLVYNDRNHYFNSNGKKDDNNNVSSGSDTSTIYQLNSISWENGIPTDIEQLFKFVIHTTQRLYKLHT